MEFDEAEHPDHDRRSRDRPRLAPRRAVRARLLGDRAQPRDGRAVDRALAVLLRLRRQPAGRLRARRDRRGDVRVGVRRVRRGRPPRAGDRPAAHGGDRGRPATGGPQADGARHELTAGSTRRSGSCRSPGPSAGCCARGRSRPTDRRRRSGDGGSGRDRWRRGAEKLGAARTRTRRNPGEPSARREARQARIRDDPRCHSSANTSHTHANVLVGHDAREADPLGTVDKFVDRSTT